MTVSQSLGSSRPHPGQRTSGHPHTGQRTTCATSATEPDSTVMVHDGPVPKHVQLREILRDLAVGTLFPGSPVPSERELSQCHGVSRITVREAVGQLVSEGVLVRVRGKGTFTAQPRETLRLDPFVSHVESATETTVLDHAESTPPAGTATALGLAPHQPAYLLMRLHSIDEVPVAVERGWYHPARVPGLLDHDLTQPVDAVLARHYGFHSQAESRTVLAEGADPDTARLLDIRSGSPMLVFHTIRAARGHPVEDVTSWYRGDRYQVAMPLERHQHHQRPHQAHPGGHP